jgi:CCR4-NOT complex subunit CAF16
MTTATPSGNPSILLENVNFRYFESESGLTDINLRVMPGECVLLIGENGSGKSTLLSLIGGRHMAASGSARILGRDAFNDTQLNGLVSLIGRPWPAEAFFGCTVDTIASPAPIPERRQRIASLIHLPMQGLVDKMSSGEKRRVQILHGMLREFDVFLLDECSTDIDVAERATVLALVRAECESRGACCIYATHILDGVGNWASQVALMRDGRLHDVRRAADVEGSLEQCAYRFLAKARDNEAPFEKPTTADEWLRRSDGYAGPGAPICDSLSSSSGEESTVAIDCRSLKYKTIFSDLTFQVTKGSRTLLLGCNGSGKSTLLSMMGGKQFFNNSSHMIKIFGKPCFEDMTLNGLVTFCGDWWVKTPGGELHVGEMITCPLTARAAHIAELLVINLGWDVRYISAGEQKRVQLFLHLSVDRPLVLLDEATADLDVDQRHKLLRFLFDESVRRGVTVVYTTHIFEGLDGWASDCIILDRTIRSAHKILRGDISLTAVTEMLIRLKQAEPPV